MAILTANDFAAQMIAQLRVLDPSVSALVGTPERKIIDTVAQALADNQVDLTGLAGALDIDSKFGTNLDRFTALFGFARQTAVAATGFVTFSRNTAAPADIQIPSGTTIQSNQVSTTGQPLQYSTTSGGTIPQGQATSAPVPVVCTTLGTAGNAPASALTELVGTVVGGVTAVTNTAPITGGRDAEDDNSYKVRFKNTVFRNLAGTEDQYLALAVSTSFTTKANIIGPVSKYREYVQVPNFDDAGYLNGVQTIAQTGNGAIGQWTTAYSSIPYAQDIYQNPMPFATNGQTGSVQYFFRNGVDFIFNAPGLLIGDAYRESGTVAQGLTAPNWTFLNVYNPVGGAAAPTGLTAVIPGQIVLTEFSYLSAASRNSIQHNVSNAVDIYVDGSNPTQTSCVFLPGAQQFTSNPTDALYFDNFRRDGEPAMRPHPGNFFTPLLNAPITSLPSTITVGTTNYYLGVHYWLVRDYSLIGGSIRARDGIEWSNYLGADNGGQTPPTNVLAPYSPTGPTINNLAPSTTVEVDNYNYDANIVILQASVENSRQITTDVLAHSAKRRFFKLDITVMYSASANYAVTNTAIGVAVQAFMNNQFFGTVIQLSDLLDVVHQVPGVDNVRWTNDLPNPPNLMRVIECDINGNPLHNPWVDRAIGGTGSSNETQRLYMPGTLYNASNGFGGVTNGFKLNWVDTGLGVNFTSNLINFDGLTAATLQTAIQASAPGTGLYHNITVTDDSTWVVNSKYPISIYNLFFGNAVGTPYLPSIVQLNVTQSPLAYDTDFFLHDDELPSLPTGTITGDTVPGVIIRPRAQNTFARPGIG